MPTGWPPAGANRPDDPRFVDGFSSRRGAYLHIPFCARICPYCDFAVVEGAEEQVERYVTAVENEMAATEVWGPLDAVFIGGGTPSYIDPSHIARLLESLGERFGLAACLPESGAEVSLEANPEDWSQDRASALHRAGVNRVSFGAQSLQAGTLAYLGRRHSPSQVVEAVELAREVGFRSVGLDLILGSPGESPARWQDTVGRVCELKPDHVSAYALTVERGTPLSRAVAAGAPAPDPDHQADAYEYARTSFERIGLVHYEISNWARPGHACVYNLIVWAGGEYLAFGLGAHRHREGRRSWNLRRLDAYLARDGCGVESSAEALDSFEKEKERLIVGLRRRVGVEAGEVGRRWAATAEFARLREAGVVALRRGRLVLVDPLRGDTAARSLAGLEANQPHPAL